MLVSIVMPVYNGEPSVGMAIESVLVQSYPHWQLIVVDDGSTDRTASIARGFDDPRILYVRQEKGGQPSALNCGLSLCEGEYVTTLDADDMLTRDSLRARVELLVSCPDHGAVYGDGYYCDAGATPLLRFSQYRPGNPVGDVYDPLTTSCFFGTGAAVMIRRRVLEERKLRYDETLSIGNDWDFYLRLAEETTFGYVDAITVLYRLHGANMTLTESPDRRVDCLLRIKRKVLRSPRFARLSPARRREFFYHLLLGDLKLRPAEQTKVMEDPQFEALPMRAQSQLLRMMAIDCILGDQSIDIATRWLETACRLAPLDWKTRMVALMTGLNPTLARLGARARRRIRAKAVPSPFDLALTGRQKT